MADNDGLPEGFEFPDDGALADIGEVDWAAALAEQAEAESAPASSAPSFDSGDMSRAAAFTAGTTKSSSSGGSSANIFPSFDAPSDGKPSVINELELILDIPVQMTVELGRTKITIRNLLQLGHGSVVELDAMAGEPMNVLVNGTLIAQGEVVVVNDKFGIRLTDIVTPAERMRKIGR